MKNNPLPLRHLMTLLQVGMLAVAGGSVAATDSVYVADEEASTVSVVETSSFKLVATIPVGQGPHNVQVSPDGRLIWVTNNGVLTEADKGPAHKSTNPGHGAASSGGEMWAINAETRDVVAKIAVGAHPAHVVVTADGQVAFVANGGDNSVSVVDIAGRRTVDTIAVGAGPHGLRISPDGKQVYVANVKADTVSVIDTATRKEIDRIVVGKGPAQVGFTPDGRYAFASLSEEDKVAVIDPASRKLIRTVSVGTVPIQVYATPDSRTLLVANQGTRDKPGKTVTFVDLATFEVVASVETGPGAHGVAIDQAGRYAFVTNTCGNTVSVIDLADRKVVATVLVGKGPNGISVTP